MASGLWSPAAAGSRPVAHPSKGPADQALSRARTERLRAHGINRQRSVIALAIGRLGNRSKPSRLRLEAALTPFATAHAMNAMVSRMVSLVYVYGLELSFDALAEMLLQLWVNALRIPGD